MTIKTIDSRQAEADQHYDRHVQRGVPPAVVATLLPMLVDGGRASQAAERFLAEQAVTGHDLSDEGRAADRQVLGQAQALHVSALRSGMFQGDVFQPAPGRYAATDEALSDEMDRTLPQRRYPGAEQNARTLAIAEQLPAIEREHGPSYVADNGDVYAKGTRTKVGHINVGSKANVGTKAGTGPSKGRLVGVDLANSTAYYVDGDDASGWDDLPGDRPYFA